MTISGSVVKEIALSSNESQALWNGTDNYGNKLSSAIYLVSAHHDMEANKVSKIAIIRK